MWVRICPSHQNQVTGKITPSKETAVSFEERVQARFLKHNSACDEEILTKIVNFVNNVIPPDDRNLDLKLTCGKVNNRLCRVETNLSGELVDTLRVLNLASGQELMPLLVDFRCKPNKTEEPEIRKSIALTQLSRHGVLSHEGYTELNCEPGVEYQWRLNIRFAASDLVVIERNLPILFLRTWRILKMEPGDFTLVSSDGKAISCHKIFLKESPFFETLFNTCSEFTETLTNEARLPEMSKEAIISLLEYVYCRTVFRANVSSQVCLELFQAAHKYMLPNLEEEMRNTLLFMDAECFALETVLSMYKFIRHYEHVDQIQLKDKVIQILRRATDLDTSPIFEKLFTEEPAIAREIAIIALKFKEQYHTSFDDE